MKRYVGEVWGQGMGSGMTIDLSPTALYAESCGSPDMSDDHRISGPACSTSPTPPYKGGVEETECRRSRAEPRRNRVMSIVILSNNDVRPYTALGRICRLVRPPRFERGTLSLEGCFRLTGRNLTDRTRHARK